MEEGWLAVALGTVAGVLSTASFVPQVLKALREGDTSASSKRMHLVNVMSFVLWTLYGFVLGSIVLVVFNGLSLALAATILFLKIRNDRRGESARSRPGASATELAEPRSS